MKKSHRDNGYMTEALTALRTLLAEEGREIPYAVDLSRQLRFIESCGEERLDLPMLPYHGYQLLESACGIL